MKNYINDNGVIFSGGYIDVDGMRIYNPTEELLVANGYHEYTYVAPIVEPSTDEAKERKMQEIDEYDKSSNVNSFTIGDKEMWLSVQERQLIATQISANEAVGRETMTRWFDGVEFTFPISTWKQMLTALEVYAGDALNVTEAHKAAVDALDSIEAINEYDYTVGYPTKLNF